MKHRHMLFLYALVGLVASALPGCGESMTPYERFEKSRIQTLGDDAIPEIVNGIRADDSFEQTLALEAVGYLTPKRRKTVWEECETSIVACLKESETRESALVAMSQINGASQEHTDALLAAVSNEGKLTAGAAMALGAAQSDDGIPVLVRGITDFNTEYDGRYDKNKSKNGTTRNAAGVALQSLAKIDSQTSRRAFETLSKKFEPFPRPYAAAVLALVQWKRSQEAVDIAHNRLAELLEIGRAYSVIDSAYSITQEIENTLPKHSIGPTKFTNWMGPKGKSAAARIRRIKQTAMQNLRKKHVRVHTQLVDELKKAKTDSTKFDKARKTLRARIFKVADSTAELLRALDPVDDDKASPVLFRALTAYSARVNQAAAKCLVRRLEPNDYADQFFAYLATRSRYSMKEIDMYSSSLADHCKHQPDTVAAALQSQLDKAHNDPRQVSWVKKVIAIDVLRDIGTKAEIPVLKRLVSDTSSFVLTTTTWGDALTPPRVSRQTIKISERAAKAIGRIQSRS